jgi:invasion protein IalB
MRNTIHLRTTFHASLAIAVVVLAAASFLNVAAAQSEEPSSTDREFQPKKVTTPRRAIVDAPFISADQVKDQVDDSELVLGVVVEGQPRAYSINMLAGPSREIINDRIGNTDFAATW